MCHDSGSWPALAELARIVIVPREISKCTLSKITAVLERFFLKFDSFTCASLWAVFKSNVLDKLSGKGKPNMESEKRVQQEKQQFS